MIERTLLFFSIVGVAMGVPAYLSQTKWDWPAPPADHSTVPLFVGGGEAGGMPAFDPSLPPAPNSSWQGASVASPHPSARLEGPPGARFEHLFRFDVTPLWVTSNWQRVTTSLSTLDLEGMRVPVVTGARPEDITGSLTYYFDRQHRVQRISFQGSTGDFQPFAAFLGQYHDLRPEPTYGAGLYVAKWNAVPRSVLRVQHFPVIDAAAPWRYQIELELNRPEDWYQLSDEMQQYLRLENRPRRGPSWLGG